MPAEKKLEHCHKLALPSRQECLKLWDYYCTPLHIREHMKQVNRVAMFIARRLKKKNININLDLVDRATLLHDTVRVTEWEHLNLPRFPYPPSKREIQAWQAQRRRFRPHYPHTLVNYQIFKKSYPAVAEIILRHNFKDVPRLKNWEEKIVSYADRRVVHDKIVTLEERFRDGFQRYHKAVPPKILTAHYALEKEIFSLIGIEPEELGLYVNFVSRGKSKGEKGEIFSKKIDYSERIDDQHAVSKSVGAVVLNHRGQVLVIFQTQNRYWEFPKGKVEEGEKELDTMKREIYEETGITKFRLLPGFRYVLTYPYYYEGKRILRNLIYFLIVTNERVRLSDEHREYVWMSPRRAKERLKHKSQRVLLDNVIAYVKRKSV